MKEFQPEPLASFSYPETRVLLGVIKAIPVTDELIGNYLYALKDKLLQQPQPIVLVNDISVARPLNAEHQLVVARFIKDNSTLIKEKVCGLIYIVPNPTLEIVLENIFKVKSPPVTYKIFIRVEDALDSAKDFLSA